MSEKENQRLYQKKNLLLLSGFLYSTAFQTPVSANKLDFNTLKNKHYNTESLTFKHSQYIVSNLNHSMQNRPLKPLISESAKQAKNPILIQSAETSKEEFSAYATAEMIKTYAKYQLEENRKSPRPVNLRSLLKQAQMEFLSQEPRDSKKTFQIIADNIHSFDWNTEERKIIFYALFRLAQLEKNQEKQILFLKEALTFEMGLKLDRQIFPPPLTSLYSKLKKSATFHQLKLKKVFPSHEILMINGKVYTNKEKVLLPYGVYRVRAFSSSHKSWQKTLSLSRLISRKVKTASLIKGSCQQADLRELDKTLSPHLRVLFPNFCVWSLPLNPIKISENLLPTEIELAEEELEQPEQNKEWWEEEWIWLGGALSLALGAIFIFSERKDEKPEKKEQKPIVKIGF